MLIETEKITQAIPSSPENVSQIDTLMEKIRQQWPIDEETQANIELVLGEAINNAILHGNKGDSKKMVRVSIECTEHHLTIIVKDEGSGFNHNTVPDPTLPENLEKPTGRGVFLMKQLADMVIFSDNGSTIEMQFKL